MASSEEQYDRTRKNNLKKSLEYVVLLRERSSPKMSMKMLRPQKGQGRRNDVNDLVQPAQDMDLYSVILIERGSTLKCITYIFSVL